MAYQKKGIKGIKNVFANGITKLDLQMLEQYNNLIKSGEPMNVALEKSLSGASKAARQLAIDANGDQVELKGLKTNAEASTLALIGMKVATVALNMALTAGLSFAIQKAVEGIDYLIHIEDKQAEKTKELAQQAKEKAESTREEYNTLTGLISKYKELSKSENRNSPEKRAEILDLQTQITDVVGAQANNLDLVNGKLDEEIKKINIINEKLLNNVVQDDKQSYITASQVVKDYTHHDANWLGDWVDYDKDSFTIDYWGDNEGRNQALDIIDKAWQSKGLGNAHEGFVDYILGIGDTFSVLNFNEGSSLRKKIDALDVAIKALEDNKDFDESNNELYTQLLNIRSEMSQAVKEQNTAATNYLKDIIEQQSLSGKSAVDSLESYKKYRDNLINKIEDDSTVSRMITDGVFDESKEKSEESIENSVDSYLGTLDEFSNYYNQWYNKFGSDVVKGINEIKKEYQSAIGHDSNNKDAQKQINEFNKWIDGLSQKDKEIVYKISCDTDTANYTLKQWKDALENYEIPKELKISFSDLIAEEDTDEEDSFTTKVDNYVNDVQELQSALSNYKSGDFATEDFVNLFEKYPEIAKHTDNLSAAIENQIKELTGYASEVDDTGTTIREASGIMKVFEDAFGRVDSEEDVKALNNFQTAVLALGEDVGSTQFSIDIDAETSGMNNFWSAIKESVSSVGLSGESIKNLKARYQELENYDPSKLFEKTSNGIHLNTKELRELESEYEKQKKLKINSDLDKLVDQYDNLTKQINKENDAEKLATLYSQRQNVLNQINDVSELATQYEGLTSAYHQWEQAQSIGEEGDMYDNLSGSLENIKKLYEDGLIGTNKFRTAVQLMSNEDLSNASGDELVKAYENGYKKMTRYFTEGENGCLNFLNDVQKLNSEWVHMNEDGTWDINFGNGDDEDVADKLGLNVETVQSIMRKLSDYGFDINLDSIFSKYDELSSKGGDAADKLKKLGLTKYSFDLDSNDLKDVNEQIEEAQDIYDKFKDSDGKVNLKVDGAKEATVVLASLLTKKQQLSAPTVMNIDTSQVEGDLGKAISLMKEYQTNYNDLEIKIAVGADTTQEQTNIQNAVKQIDKLPNSIKTKLGLDDTEFKTALKNVQNTDIKAGAKINQDDLDLIKEKIAKINPDMLVKAGVDASLIDGYNFNRDATVTYNYNKSIVDSWNFNKNATITYNPVINSVAGGAAGSVVNTVGSWISSLFGGNSKGDNKKTKASGTAHAQGNWGTKDSGTALGGEIGQELVVRNGKFFTIGDESAEFFKYQKGDIIFNAEQTRQIFQNGKITNGKKRGISYAEGTAFSNGTGSIIVNGKVKTSPSNSDNSSTTSDTPQTIDWIEVSISRIERAINRLKTTAESAFKSLKSKLSATNKEIHSVSEEISIQQAAYDRYIQQANSIGLSSGLKQRVRDGTINIGEYNSETAELIQKYQEWYEKALSCKDAIQELNESLASLYENKFNNIASDYDNKLSQIEHLTQTYQNKVSLIEKQNYFVATKYYEQLKTAEQKNMNMLNDELADLTQSFNEAMSSGKIAKYSQAWYDMQEQIDAVDESIQESTISLAEYENTMQELEWSYFDFLQDQISNITSEADFLVDLMSNSDMFNDNGNFTDKGLATVGLHGVNYNTYMAQADEYAEELLNINKQLADDPSNTALIKRRKELLELQQESILASEKEKEAIRDIISDGIKIELDALQDLIDKYNDAMDTQKDLYDYQKKVEDQTNEISSLQKQLSAYTGDVSEETKAKIQKLEVDLVEAQTELEETEYEQYISDTKQLLDNLYDEYELLLNERLDNVDILISDMIDTINLNSGDIKNTLTQVGHDVGYTLTDSMTNIWNNASTSTGDILTTYGDNFREQLTSLNTVLNTISADVSLLTGGSSRSSSTSNSSTPSSKNSKTTNTSTKKTSSTSKGNGKIEVGDKVKFNFGKYYESSYGIGEWGNKYQGQSVYITSINPGSPYPYHISTGKKLGQGDLGWLKANQISGYKTGGLADYTGIAWLDGTPSQPEMVLNAEDTNNFLKLRDVLRKISQKELTVYGQSVNSNSYGVDILPQVSGISEASRILTSLQNNSVFRSRESNFGDININIEHVEDYNDFVRQLQKDKKFEQLIQTMTIDRLNGKSSLAKNNIKWS